MNDEWHRHEIQLSTVHVSVLERAADKPSTEAPLLLLHGLVAEANTFRRLMSALPQNRRVLALDLPGAGYSERSPRLDASFGGMAGLVGEAIGSLGLQRPVVVGHSHGGAVALELASHTPELVSGMVLICPAHPFSGREDSLVRFYTSRIGNAFAHLLPRLPDWLHLFVFRHMPGGRREFSAADLEPYLHTLREPGTVDHLLTLLRSWKVDMARLRDKMTAEPLSVPTLLLWGEKDVVVPPASAEELTHHIQRWELIELPNVGHLPNEEAPRQSAALITDWLIRNCMDQQRAF